MTVCAVPVFCRGCFSDILISREKTDKVFLRPESGCLLFQGVESSVNSFSDFFGCTFQEPFFCAESFPDITDSQRRTEMKKQPEIALQKPDRFEHGRIAAVVCAQRINGNALASGTGAHEITHRAVHDPVEVCPGALTQCTSLHSGCCAEIGKHHIPDSKRLGGRLFSRLSDRKAVKFEKVRKISRLEVIPEYYGRVLQLFFRNPFQPFEDNAVLFCLICAAEALYRFAFTPESCNFLRKAVPVLLYDKTGSPDNRPAASIIDRETDDGSIGVIFQKIPETPGDAPRKP